MVKQPTELAKELGVGPTLFLMSTRSMAVLFLVLTIVNIPLFAFYYSGSKNADSGGKAVKGDSFDDYFALLSLGNTGQNEFTCSEAQLDQCYKWKDRWWKGTEPTDPYDTMCGRALYDCKTCIEDQDFTLNLQCGAGLTLGKIKEIGFAKDNGQ